MAPDGMNMNPNSDSIPDALNTPSHSGGESCAVDATNEKDRGAIRNAVKQWPKRFAAITPERKAKWVAQLEEAGDVASDLMRNAEETPVRLKAADTVNSVVRTAGMLEGLNQADEHLAEKHAREDAGKGPTVTHKLYGVNAPVEAV